MFDGRYLDWNQKRIKGIIEFYGHNFFHLKRVLDLGCGHADISGALYRLGADVTAVDARQEHLKIAAKKFSGIKTVKADLDRGWPFYGKMFDLILDLDLLCHINNYENHLKSVCASTTHLILETAVCDDADPFKCIVSTENKSIYDLSVNGITSFPTANAIERVLRENGMNFKRLDSSKFNSGSYSYDWQESKNSDCNMNKRRIWIAYKNTSAIQFPEPSKELPIVQQSNIGCVTTLQNSRIPVVQPYIKTVKSQNATSDNKKVKTALCISGHLRTFEGNFKSVYDNIINRLDCDVFIHTWDKMGLQWRFTDSNLHMIETEYLESRIKQLYNPKKLVIEKYRQMPTTPIMFKKQIDHRDVPGILSMFYKIEACNELKKQYENENNFKYDCVIRFRGDLSMESPIPVDSNTNLNYLFLPVFGNFAGLCDQIAYGSSEIMDKYSNIYSQIPTHLESGCPMHPEKLVQYHVNVNKIPISKVNLQYVIKRANGLIQNNMLLERAQGFIR